MTVMSGFWCGNLVKLDQYDSIVFSPLPRHFKMSTLSIAMVLLVT